jgi:hypothetical protein
MTGTNKFWQTSLLLCLAFTCTAFGHAQNKMTQAQAPKKTAPDTTTSPSPSIDFDGNVASGNTFKIKGDKARVSVLPARPGATDCKTGSMLDLLSSLDLQMPGAATTTKQILFDPSISSLISLANAVKAGDKLCLVAFASVSPTSPYYSPKPTTVIGAAQSTTPSIEIMDVAGLVPGANTIWVQGSRGDTITIFSFAAGYTPQFPATSPSGSIFCTEADIATGPTVLKFKTPGIKDYQTNWALPDNTAYAIQLQNPLAAGTKLCIYDSHYDKKEELSYFATVQNAAVPAATTEAVVIKPVAPAATVPASIPTAPATAGAVPAATPGVAVSCGTPGKYSDCTFEYLLIGGIEQAGLSAQNSVTEGFYDLFLRRPVDSNWGSIWFRSRYLGTPSSSSTQNIVSAASNPTGTLTASNLPQSVAAVDYALGLQFDHWVYRNQRFSYSPIVGVGATTPLSATTTVAGYVVPAYGTNECNQLQARFGATQGYKPSLPPSGLYGASPGTMGCVVQPNPLSTTANPLPGTQITDIAFSNEDRSSFLMKWGAGVRIIDRSLPSDSSGCSSSKGCSRLMADIILGQDQSITGGYLRHFVLKTDAIIPVFSTGAYFFASSANRLERNTTLSPLILSPVTVATNTSSSACVASATTVCFPSPSVFVLPYKQQNRDYYRIGIGIDITKVFAKLFSPAPAPTTPATP